MEWVIPVAVLLVVLTATVVFRRFVARRYEEIYCADDPSYQDPPALPNLPTSGGIG